MAMETHEPMNEYTLLQCEIQVEHRKIRFRTYQLTCVSWMTIMPCHAKQETSSHASKVVTSNNGRHRHRIASWKQAGEETKDVENL